MRFSTLITQYDYNEFKKYYQEIENRKKFHVVDNIAMKKIFFPIFNIFLSVLIFVFYDKLLDSQITKKINQECLFTSLAIIFMVGVPLIFVNMLIWHLLTKNRVAQCDGGPVLGRHEYIIANGRVVDKINGNIFVSRFKNIIKVHETYNNIFILIDNDRAYLVNKNTIRPGEDKEVIVSNIFRLKNNITA